MKNWRAELTAEGQTLAEVKIQRGIFKREATVIRYNDHATQLGSAQGATNLQNHKKRLITLCTWMI